MHDWLADPGVQERLKAAKPSMQPILLRNFEISEDRFNEWMTTGVVPSLAIEEPVAHPADLVPDIEPYERSEEDQEIDRLLDSIDILDAYARWSRHPGWTPKVGSKRESIMIRCPVPEHGPDEDPSAWVNLDKNVYYCEKCSQGGDKFDLAAWHYGYDVPGYKKQGFRELRHKMAEDLGFHIQRTAGGNIIVTPPKEAEPSSQGAPPPPDSPAPTPEPTNVVKLPFLQPEPDEEEDDDDFEVPAIPSDLRLDWEAITVQDTFMDEWMTATAEVDDLPHEFYYFIGLQAIAAAAGFNVVLNDRPNVKGNLLVCNYGPTGSGKSRAIGQQTTLLHEALGWEPGDEFTDPSGVLMMQSVGSSESLIDSLSHPIQDASTMQVIRHASVNCVMRNDEFAGFVARASRAGNTLREMLIELYDHRGGTMTHQSRTHGMVKAYNPFFQMVTSTQPKAIHAFLNRTDSENGFVNRFIYATGQRRRDLISYGGTSFHLSGAIDALKDLSRWSGTGHSYVLQGASFDVWNDFFQREMVPLKDSANTESILARIDLTLKKFIVLLSINERLAQPTPEVVERAISMFEYLRLTGLMMSGNLQDDELSQCITKIGEVCKRFQRRTGHGPTMREIRQATTRMFGVQMLHRATKVMTDLYMLEEVRQKNQRGPATLRYEYVGGN